ncbi:hydrolase [Streptomyces cinnamoneus]|uniref:Hydrolase n=1 Tax=Streptomyces cinnamoneus TaxID=53446 RepID=A0A2G1XPM9_STRCJ|nr:HAD family hydrolase [Streptomyces cinnamoneus]PHQ53173.1 hydrolase [Streptomyces cinnamoneus]PPT12265.1 HAD family hydrolase [Streptomyces cinnamoneus]
MIEAVVFDVGETLIRDDRGWQRWADWLGVPRHTLSALVGAVVAQGRDNADALRLARPGVDIGAEYRAREAAGHGEMLDESDLYPDVRPALTAMRDSGLRVIIAGNQTRRAGELLAALDLPAHAVATSGEWGVAKPDPAFFARVIALAGAAPTRIAYVGDHPQNDVVPAAAAGLRTVHIRRGPYGHLWADSPEARTADWRVQSLTELAGLLVR